MKNKKVLIVALLVIAAVAFSMFYIEKDDFDKVPYSTFYSSLESGVIESVQIKENKIIFTKSESQYQTVNPHSPTLEEYVLRYVDDVKVESTSQELLTTILDVIFYVFFFGIFIVVFVKFISPNTFKVVHKTGVHFSDVVGMESLKKDMLQVTKIMRAPNEYAKKGIRLPKGILLEGEPGNGKTLFAKAVAQEAKVSFIAAKATDFESMFMAIGPMKVKMLFRKARKHAPCIVFIDEFDGIGTRRNYSGSAIETENTRIVTALLNELDGFEKTSGVVVIAATNSIEALDPALIRPGRFDAKFSVPYPNKDERIQLIKMYCKNKAFEDECKEEKLAELFKDFSCAKIESVLNKASLLASQNEREKFNLDDVYNAIKTL